MTLVAYLENILAGLFREVYTAINGSVPRWSVPRGKIQYCGQQLLRRFLQVGHMCFPYIVSQYGEKTGNSYGDPHRVGQQVLCAASKGTERAVTSIFQPYNNGSQHCRELRRP